MTAKRTADSERVIRYHLIHDAMVGVSLFLLVVGSLLSARLLNQRQFIFGQASGFTDAASNQAGDQLESGLGSLMSDLAFELGWAGDGQILADAWNQFIGQPQEMIFHQPEFESIAQAVVEPRSAVLGTSSQPERPPVSEISPWYKPGAATDRAPAHLTPKSDTVVLTPTSEAFVSIATPPKGERGNQTGFVGLETISRETKAYIEYVAQTRVSKLEFYVDGFIVTTDQQPPYYLGGGIAFEPNGYDLSSLNSGPHQLSVIGYNDSGDIIISEGVDILLD